MKNWLLLVLICGATILAIFLYSKIHIFQSTNNAAIKPVVIIIGDSNSDVQSITQVRKWSQDYALAHQQDKVVLNMAIGGHAVEDFNIEEVFQELKTQVQTLPPQSPILFVTMLGTNNAIMSNKIASPEQFVSNYAKLLQKLVEMTKSDSVIIGSIPPAYPLPGNQVAYEPNFKAYLLIDQFNIELENWVKMQKKIGTATLTFVPILPKEAYGVERIADFLIFDGVHLNQSAQEIVGERINSAVESALKTK